MRFNFQLFDIYKHDSDCWGMNILTFGMLGKSLFGFNSDEDGCYLSLAWTAELKIARNK